jgi:glycosyltransferase involved in cell wall biosynthesis
MKLLISGYSCRPGAGSEPGIGWNIARELAQEFEVVVVTRAKNRRPIEEELQARPCPNLRFVYADVPQALWMKRFPGGTHFYYYLWQLRLPRIVSDLVSELTFDITHHVTFGRYWTPSLLWRMGKPFVWGPVGGGESAPFRFQRAFGVRGLAYEVIRSLARALGELDPLVRRTAKHSALALGTTNRTADRLRALGAGRVRVFEQVGLSAEDVELLAQISEPPSSGPVRFISIGRLLHWKGVHLGLRALAAMGQQHEYWVVGEGPEKKRLEALAVSLGLGGRARFLGALPRSRVFEELSRSHVLVHPSFHDSGGWVCLEAMAAGRPVICLDTGGPSLLVSKETGIKIPVGEPAQVHRDLAHAFVTLSSDPERRRDMGRSGRERVAESFLWSQRAQQLADLMREVIR